MKVKGIMFYGFAAAILTGTAHAAPTPFTIASQAYVDEQVSSVSSTSSAAVDALKDRATALEEKVGNTSVESQITTALGSYTNTTGMTSAISTAKSEAISDAATAAAGLYQTLGNKVENLNNADNTHYPTALAVKNAIDGVSSGASSRLGDLESTVNNETSGVAATYAIATANQSNISTNAGTMNDHIANKNNPHEVTKAQVGLGNVDNTSDADKPVSTATQAALNLKQNVSDSTVATAEAGTYTAITAGNGVGDNLEALDSHLKTAEGKITALEGTVGDANSGLVKDVASLKSNMGQSGSVADQIAAKLGNDFPANSTVKAQLDLKQDASKSTVANGTYAHITQGDGVAANLLSLNSALVTAESSITTINSSAVMNSGIDSTKVGQIATNTTNISNNANNISGLDTRTAILANKTCTAQSGRCVLSVDNSGNLAWVAVTDPAESNNE